MRSGGGSSGTRSTLTSGSSVAMAGDGGGTAIAVNDQVAIVTEWQDEQPHAKPRCAAEAACSEIAGAVGALVSLELADD